MKITRNTPEQLIIENRPIWLAIGVSLGGLLFVGLGLSIFPQDPVEGLIFAAAGLFFAVVFNLAFVRRTMLILDGPRQLVELRRRSWLGYSRRTWDLRHLGGAYVQSSSSDGTPTYRAALRITDGMDAGNHPITLVYSSGKGADRARRAVNDWLDRQRRAA